MKKLIVLISALAAVSIAQAEDQKSSKTIKGEATCAKCTLKEADAKTCVTAIQTMEAGKQVTYYVAQNDVAKKFHSNVCTDTKKVTAQGSVKEVNGKKEITLTQIDLDKAEKAPSTN